ncbi:unnamed protein product [Spirodela intermedia]|uniref:Uncharacterized protein n=2 Tax=Spirodela intermedia TaxID=51605 RepID=A0A7I8KGB6_SPIIN|nr:unnamed protein product [Spirodela intermedia]CAA6659901.1 unnamed protein product [Spirodela intermedia]CAA7396224.1 unnamed protein product [Spirodela intermedia]
MMLCKGRSGTTVQLLVLPSPAATAARGGGTAAATGVGGGELVCLQLEEGWEERAVDLGTIGKALALEPLSIRLNGYMLGATAPDFVAISVTWGSLLSHFSARRLPTGCPAAGAAPNNERPMKREKICIKMTVTLDDDDGPAKERKSVAGSGVASNCLARHRTKRSREGDLVMAALPCKRAA